MNNMMLVIRYILLFFISILAVACSNGNSEVSTTPDSGTQVIMDNNSGGVANGATNVLKTPNIVLGFKNAMNPSTVNNTSVLLSTTPDATGVISIGSITSNVNNTKFYFSPESALNDNTKYYIIVTDKVTTQTGESIPTTIFSFTTGDSTAPTVTMIDPSNNASGITKSPNINIQFSEAVKNVNHTTVILHEGSPTGSVVTTSSIILGSDNMYSFSPINRLKELTAYYVVINSGISDMAGNQLIPATYSFTTGDSTAPTVTMIDPSNNASGITKSPNINIQFSEAVKNVNHTTVILHEGSPTGSVVTTSSIILGSNNMYSFRPINGLKELTAYYLVINSGISDMAGNQLIPATYSFTTGDSTAPTVTMIAPSNNEWNVLRYSPEISFIFSEEVKDVNLYNVTLTNMDNGSRMEGRISHDGEVIYSFIPSIILAPDTMYQVIFSSNIKDFAGNSLISTKSVFRTSF